MPQTEQLSSRTGSLSVVTFQLGGEVCAVPITDVFQIIRDTPITKVPNVSSHVEGVLNLRGVLVPIIDIKHFLGLGVRELGEEHRLMIVELDGRSVGFSVDSIGGVLEFDRAELQAAPDVVEAKMERHFVRGVVRRQDGIVVLLDIAEVLKKRKDRGGSEATPVAGGAVARS